MNKYLIKVDEITFSGKILNTYSQTVEGEELIIPGFEQVKLFTRKEIPDDEIGECWSVSEVTTGAAIIEVGRCMPTKEAAIEAATRLLNEKGLKLTLEKIKNLPLVTSFPEC